MGRFIVIGILYKVRVNTRIDDNIASSLKERFPEQLFDYKQIKEKQMLSLREDIPPESIAELRTKVLSVCKLPAEKDEESFNVRLCQATSIQELEDISREHGHYSFLHEERSWILNLDGENVKATYEYFILYSSGGKFYSCEGYSFHEITQKTRRLIYLAIPDPIVELIEVFIDG